MCLCLVEATGFGKQSIVITAFPASSHPRHYSIGDSVSDQAVLQNGKILAAGAGGGNYALARYQEDGSLDTNFGNQGIVLTEFGGISGIKKLLFQPDGKIIAAGFAYQVNRSDIALVRYSPDGSIDSAFGQEGRVTANFGFQDSIIDAALRPDGKILLAGSANSEQKYVSGFEFLALYNPDGAFDVSCGSGGVKDVSNYLIGINTFAFQPDGKLLLAGSINLKFGLEKLQPAPGNCLFSGG